MQSIKSRFYLLFLFLFFIISPSNILAKDSITWMEAVAPPFFIHDGDLKGQGYEDLITDLLAENLPLYEHKRTVATISRHYQQWKQGEKVLFSCNV